MAWRLEPVRQAVRCARTSPPAANVCAPAATDGLFARAQLDEYKAAERDRERKRDRSARQRPADSSQQWAKRTKAKREQLFAEEAAAAKAACRAVDVTLAVKPKYISDGYLTCPRLYNHLQEAAEAERDWQERVREGRFVVLRVKPSLDLHTVEHLMSIRQRGIGWHTAWISACESKNK